MGTMLNLFIGFGRMAIFTVLILLIHEHEKYLYLLRYFSIISFEDLIFLSYMSFTCLFSLSSTYLILFEDIMDGVIYLIFNSICNFCIGWLLTFFELIFHSESFLEVFISCRSLILELCILCMELMYSIISSAK
jgi:hypothetical protein